MPREGKHLAPVDDRRIAWELPNDASARPALRSAAFPNRARRSDDDVLRFRPLSQVLSKRYAKAKSDKYSGNIHKRNNVPQSVAGKKSYPFTVGPVLLAFFLFVVLGSSLLELLFKVAG